MTLKTYVWGMRSVTLVSVIGFILILNYIDPDNSGYVGKGMFYLTLFFVLSGFFNLLLLRLRKKITNKETANSNVSLSLRQAILLSLMIIILFILQSFRILTWWDGLLVLAGIFILELFFLSR